MKDKINERLNDFLKNAEEENKYLKGLWTGVMYSVSTLVTIVAVVLIVFYDYQEFAIMLLFAGSVGVILCFVLATRKYIDRKDAVGKKLRIYYAIGFVLVVAMVLILAQSCQNWDCTFPRRTSDFSFLVFFGLIAVAERTIKQIRKEEAKLKEETENVTA